MEIWNRSFRHHLCRRRRYGNKFEEVRFAGLKAGATGILGAILNMCNEGKTVEDIKDFCEKSLNLKGMKK